MKQFMQKQKKRQEKKEKQFYNVYICLIIMCPFVYILNLLKINK